MTLEDIITKTKIRVANGQEPIFIMVAGGSATGKSSQVLPALLQAFGEDALLVEQDWYQLGIRFTDKDKSPYKWDDPRNFQIDQLAHDLNDLRVGKTVYAPSFDVVSVESVGERALKPRPIIIVDGIYTLHSSLEKIADYSIYVEMPLYGRFLRRLFRMIYDQKQNKPQTAFKQVFGPVLRAHRDFVSKQADVADCVIKATYSFSDTIARYNLLPTGFQLPANAEKLWSHEGLYFLGQEESEGYHFYIVYGNKVYYHFIITPEQRELLQDIDYYAV